MNHSSLFRNTSTGLVIFAFGLFISAVFFGYSSESVHFSEDLALSFAAVREILSGNLLLLGPPSHIGGRHLGPEYYYYMTTLRLLSGGGIFAAMVLDTIVKVCSLLCLAFLSAGLAPKKYRLAGVAVFFTLAVSSHYLEVIRNSWHTYALLPFLTGFLWAARRVFRDGWPAFAGLFLTATLLVQTHFMATPFVAAVGLVAAAFLVSREKYSVTGSLRALLSSCGDNLRTFGAGILLWLPFIFYQLHYGSALGGIKNHAVLPGQRLGIQAGFDATFNFFVDFGLGSNALHFLKDWHTGSLPPVFLLLLLLAYGLYRNRVRSRERAGDDGCISFIAAMLAGALAYIPAVAWLQGPFFDYYLYALLPLPLILATFAATSLLELIEELWPQGRARSIAFGGLALVLIAAGVSNIIAAVNLPAKAPFYSLTHARDMASFLIKQHGSNECPEFVIPTGHKVMKDAYLFFYDQKCFDKMNYRDSFAELPPPASRQPSTGNEPGYLITCPRPYSKEQRRLEALVTDKWDIEGILHDDSADSNSVSRCLIAKLKSPVSQAE